MTMIAENGASNLSEHVSIFDVLESRNEGDICAILPESESSILLGEWGCFCASCIADEAQWWDYIVLPAEHWLLGKVHPKKREQVLIVALKIYIFGSCILHWYNALVERFHAHPSL